MIAHVARPSRIGLVALISALLLATAVAAGLAGASPVRAGTEHLVEIVDFDYAPRELTITVGDTVTWTNRDVVAHTATSTSGGWDSGDLEQGESYSLTFTAAGTYDYLCTPHPSMTGRIVVVAAPPSAAPVPPAAPPPTPSPSTGGSLPDVAMATERAEWMTPAGLGLLGIGALIAVAGSARRALARRRIG